MSLSCAQIRNKVKSLIAPQNGIKYVFNRNPRNLEKLRIAYKNDGYQLEKAGRCFWHKLDLKCSQKHVSAEIKHFQAGTVLSASTSEWAIKKQLFKTNDISAYINVARVLAQRCLEAGLTEVRCDIKGVKNGKVEKFLNTLQENGVVLTEPERFLPHRPWSVDRPSKPWEEVE